MGTWCAKKPGGGNRNYGMLEVRLHQLSRSLSGYSVAFRPDLCKRL